MALIDGRDVAQRFAVARGDGRGVVNCHGLFASGFDGLKGTDTSTWFIVRCRQYATTVQSARPICDLEHTYLSGWRHQKSHDDRPRHAKAFGYRGAPR